MNKLLLPLILLAIWLIGGSIFFKNRICGTPAVVEKATAVIPPPVDDTRLLIQDGSAFKSTAADHFDFSKSSYNYIAPLSVGVNNSLEQAASYLKANPERSMTITGLYKEEEENSSVFPTLGLARANEIKKAFATLGVDAKQLLTADRLLGSTTSFNDDVLLDGAEFSFSKTTEDLADRLAVIKARLDANPITIYFKTGEQNVALTQAQKQDFADLVFYLDNVKDSRAEVGGHTDNVGDSALNSRLSRKRAEFVREYLIGNGLVASKMSPANGYGQTKPIAPNDTSEGRAKNRRVEVRLK